jgi:hypothetical protein
MFHIGQLVVCVKWKGSRLSIKNVPAKAIFPNRGIIYTVRDVLDYGDVILLRLMEIDNTHLGFWSEPGFNTSGFRPVQDNRIAIFRQLLVTPPKQKVDA